MKKNQLQTHIDSIKEQLIQKYKAEKIILFGSASVGKATADSDIDFLVIKNDKRTFHNRLVNLYSLIKKEVAADFIVYTPDEFSKRLKMGDPFAKYILTNGKVLYG